jgi:hypothetical protein
VSGHFEEFERFDKVTGEGVTLAKVLVVGIVFVNTQTVMPTWNAFELLEFRRPSWMLTLV